MKNECWVVIYKTGEWSDRSEDVHSVYEHKADAESMCETLNCELKEMKLHFSNIDEYQYESRKFQGRVVDYTGAAFYITGPVDYYL
jgi:hypothetical protein